MGRVCSGSLAADRVRLPQLGPEDLSEAGKLISKASASVEVEVPSVARKPPVADVGDSPVGPRFEVNDEIHAAAIWAVDLTPAENHLTTVPDTTDLPGRESERGQDRIESVRNEDLCTPVRTTTSCNQARTSVSRPRWNARPRHVRWMLPRRSDSPRRRRGSSAHLCSTRPHVWESVAPQGLKPSQRLESLPTNHVRTAATDQLGFQPTKGLVGDTGLEPVTSCMSSKCSNQLS